MADNNFMEPVAWHASLAGVVATAAGLIHDHAGNVLIVKPNYRDLWSLPGGICEFGEAPHAGCAREVAEEIGLSLPVGRLLSIDWQLSSPIYGPAARPVVYFIFDCGTLPGTSDIQLQADELDDCTFAAQEDLGGLLPSFALRRVQEAIAARASGCVRYVPLPDGDGAARRGT